MRRALPSLHRIAGHTYVSSLLPRQPVILDLGANAGAFSGEMARRYDAHCIAVEPNPELVALLKREQVGESVIGIGITKRSGNAELYISGKSDASSFHPLSRQNAEQAISVLTESLPELLETIDVNHIDLLKMDIEGAEIAALLQLSSPWLQRISQITVEFHDSQKYVTKEEIRSVHRHLLAAGYARFRNSVRDYSDVLYVHSELLGASEKLFLKYIALPTRASRRYLKRIIKMD